MSPLLIQLGLSAANAGGTALYNGITGDIENNVNNPAISNYLTNVSAINSQIAEQQAFDAVNSNLKDFSNVDNNDALLNLGIQQTSTVNEPNGWQNIGMYTGKQLQNLGNLDIVGTYDTAIQMYKDLFNIGNDSKADKINKEINRINQQNIDNFYNQVTANNKRQQRQAMMNYFAEGGSLDESNGVTTFRGLKHGQFGLEGIPQGIASDGMINYVQGGGFDKNGNPLKGEIKYKDYIYGKLKITKKLADKYHLPEKWVGLKYQEAADDAQQESKDRPNDPISLKSLDEWMTRLQGAQEEQKLAAATKEAAKAVDNMSDEEKAALLSSLEQPMTQQEGIDLSQPMYAKGGKIHIKPSKRGTFTAAAKKHGKSVQAFASQVLANKENYSPAMVKKANFARNSAKWHAEGGHLFDKGGYPFGALGSGVEYIMGNYNPLTQTQIDVLQNMADFANSNLPENLNTLRFGINQPKNNIELMAVTNPTEVSQGAVPITKSVTYTPDTDNNTKGSSNWLGNLFGNIGGESLRKAPVWGALLGALEARLQPKDFTVGNTDRQLASQIGPIGTPHVGNYETLHLLDPNLTYSNNLAILARSLSDNRGLPAATRNALNSFTISKMQEKQALDNFNWQQANNAERQRVATHDLGINKFNAQLTQADNQLNNARLMARLSLLEKAALADDASKTAWAQNVSGTTENLWNQLGNLGKDEWSRKAALAYMAEHPELQSSDIYKLIVGSYIG